MTETAVNRAVNNARHDEPDCVEAFQRHSAKLKFTAAVIQTALRLCSRMKAEVHGWPFATAS